ncbi:MAG: YkgJ family cysteine cluster protein [Planctomycetaceae bacterium]|jgi:hypothetical protein|nr:YkgJ family cysteine cluster protein [Planctomycetaceae bacterium]
MPQDPWYRDGLHFECTACGNCCTGSPGVVWIDDDDIRRIAEFTGRGEAEIRVMHTRPYANRLSLTEYANGDCTFFDGNLRRCTIYPVRPAQCRTWPFWRSNLESPHSWNNLGLECPGVGQGCLVPLEIIEAHVSEIDV